uniref:FAD-binding protein n=1 Tax=Limnohabitans sp. TaxID=1907725 RepID=UPI004047A5BD
LFGGMMVSGGDLQHLLRAKRSLRSSWYVARILGRHLRDRLHFARGTRLTNGNALAARLLYRYLELDGHIIISARLRQLKKVDGRVTGCIVDVEGRMHDLHATQAVVLATGGFGHNQAMRSPPKVLPAANATNSVSLVPQSVIGEGVSSAVSVGALIDRRQHDIAAWVPVSAVPSSTSPDRYFPHFFDRSKPGFVMVSREGKRFVNEASSYHDIGRTMRLCCIDEAFIICDHLALSRYGVGVVPPLGLLANRWVRSGYLKCGNDMPSLARAAGIDPTGLKDTISAYNEFARAGHDPTFGKGLSAYDRYIGDLDANGNSCVAELQRPPFYAIRVVLGDIGTFCGLATEISGRVLDLARKPIAGLYAVGNDRASIFGGTYPAAGITLGPALVHAVIAARHISDEARNVNE